MSRRAGRIPLGLALACVVIVALAAGDRASASVVRFTTNLGTFDVNLSTSGSLATTVNNFLTYVTSTAYANSIIHRSTTYDPGTIQIVQGGGYVLQGNTISVIPAGTPIPLQAGVANSRGTIAMARTSEPNSATSGWYFNVEDNVGLDFNYAVFGNVINTADNAGMAVIDAIAAVEVYNASAFLGVAFSELPLLQPSLAPQNLVTVQNVVQLPPASSIVIGVASGNTVTQLETGYPVLSGTVPVDKTGGGTLVVGGANTATGTFRIQAGAAAVPTASAVANFAALDVAAGASLDVTAISGGYTVTGGQTIAGSGTVLGAMRFGSGATLAPGGTAAAPVIAVITVPEPSAGGLGVAAVALLGLAGLCRTRQSTSNPRSRIARRSASVTNDRSWSR